MRHPWLRPVLSWRTDGLVPSLILIAWLLGEPVAAQGVQRAAVALPAGTRMFTPVAVFGTDDRVPVPAKLQPLRERIGVLFNIRQRTVCTAFCVAPTIIGTAAHCLFKTQGEKPPKLADFWFARNYDTVRDYARVAGHDRGAAGQNVMTGSFGLSTTPPIEATSDWAFVRLSRAVCSKGVFEMAPLPAEQVIEASAEGRIFQISYHKDYKQWQPAYSKPCALDRTFSGVSWRTIAADFVTPEALLLHTCDTGGASSGSPLLIETPTGAKVVGINVGTYVRSRAVVHDRDTTDKSKADSIANTGVASTAFTRRLEAFRSAHILSDAAAMREVQERLQRGRFYNGAVDGTFGPALARAIEAFEVAARVPTTGLASEDVLARLRLDPATALPVR